MKRYFPLGPPFYGKVEEDYQADLIHKAAWTFLFVITFLGAVLIILLPNNWRRVVEAAICFDVISLTCLVLNNRRRLYLASTVFPASLWLLTTLLAYTSGGIYAPVLAGYLPVIIIAGFLSGGISGIMMAALCSLSALAFAILEIQGSLPVRHIVHTPVTAWVLYSLVGILVTAIQYWVVGHIRKSFKTIAQETDERKRTETLLNESEFNNRMVVQNKILGIAWASPEGKLLSASATFCEMLGYTEEELKGAYFGDFTHPQDVPRELMLLERMANKEIESYLIEKRYKRKGGEYLWVELNLTAYRNTATQATDFYIGIIQNIQLKKEAEEALKESEEKYRYLFNNNPSLIFIWDLNDLRITEVNETALSEYGYSRDEIMKMTVLDLRLPEDHEKIKAFALRMLTVPELKSRGTWRHLKKNGELMYMDISSHRIIYKSRISILSIAENVTEKVMIEEQLKRSYEDIRLLNAHLETVREEERTAIAREIHDELGQQLTGLKMDASWLAKKSNPEDKAAQERFADMFSLIDSTINTVRKISSELRPGLLDDLGLQAALEWQSNEFEKRTGIRCALQIKLNDHFFEKDLSTGVFRVYQEALTNVTRHAGATEVVTAFEIVEDHLVLSVKDNGTGFDTRDAENKNTLGLLGMKERARLFNGELKIESEKGKGTTVILKVPMAITTDKIPA